MSSLCVGISSITDGIGVPDPNPKHLVNWCCLIQISQYDICLNWFSGALVGVGGVTVEAEVESHDDLCRHCTSKQKLYVCVYIYIYVYI